MGPKTEKQRKTTAADKSVTLSDPINTSEWKCVVALTVGTSQYDTFLAKRFAEEASSGIRREIKSIDLDRDIMRILKEFVSGEVNYRYSFLFNFSSVFEEASEYIKADESIPAELMVKILKAVILMMREDDIERRLKATECKNDPIEIMASKPLYPITGNDPNGKDKSRKESLGMEKKRPALGKTSQTRSNTVGTFRLRPPTVSKEDTKLLKRGEPIKDSEVIDDAPEEGYFQLYIALTGFDQPDLALEMVKFDIPLHSVLCLNSTTSSEVRPSVVSTVRGDTDQFWEDFLRMIWDQGLHPNFSDIVFQMYAPTELPKESKQLKEFIYKEISFLLYDLSDLRLQQKNYLRHMRVWNVSEEMERFSIATNMLREVDKLPYECTTVPVLMQFLLDVLCGEDYEDEMIEYEGEVTNSMSIPSTFATKSYLDDRGSNISFTSLIPFRSAVKLQTPRWSTVVDTDEKEILYKKMKELDILYGIEEYNDPFGVEYSADVGHPCVVKKKRLPCKNLDLEFQTSSAFLSRIWQNYPREVDDCECGRRYPCGIRFPEVTLNYCMYVAWIGRLECGPLIREAPYREASAPDFPESPSLTHFTITDGSRILLQKTLQPYARKDFFSPSELKVVDSKTLLSTSAPEIWQCPKVQWTDKSFVSDSHIPVKYLRGLPMGVYDDLTQFIGEEIFECLRGYDFVEELSKKDLVRRIEECLQDYDGLRQAYSPLTDTVYLVMYNTYADIKRDTYNVNLRTPVGLRDFYDYVLDDEKDWFDEQKPFVIKETETHKVDGCPNVLYDPTPVFRDFPESDFWHEDSIKYALHAESILEDAARTVELQMSKKDVAEDRQTRGKKRLSEEPIGNSPPGDDFSATFAAPGEPYDFIGYDLGTGAVQYSGLDTTYRGAGGCTVRASLRERLYGTQELGVHVRQGGHTLHLYSYVCPTPHVERPYTCHLEYNNGIIVAFSQRTYQCPNDFGLPEDFQQNAFAEDDGFAFDMKLSLPNGLTLQPVSGCRSPGYIKQSYLIKGEDCPTSVRQEKSRLFMSNGTVVKMMEDNTVQIFKMDTSIVTASLDDLDSRSGCPSDCNECCGEDCSARDFRKWYFHSYAETMTNGCHYEVLNNEVFSAKRFHTFISTDMQSQTKYFRRMDSTNYVLSTDGMSCVEFPDGTKIALYLEEEDLYMKDIDDDFAYGEDLVEDLYVVIHKRIVAEHPYYATTIFDERRNSWKILLPDKSQIEIYSSGRYRVDLDEKVDFEINAKQITMCRYGRSDELMMKTTADLTAFDGDADADVPYCTTIDATGKRFIIEANSNCKLIEETEEDRSEMPSDAEDLPERRYFVLRRDWSGFEIKHASAVQKEVESVERDVIAYVQQLDPERTRYYAFLQEVHDPPRRKWAVDSITPTVKCSANDAVAHISTTYGIPPSWMHPFPKRKRKFEIPKFLSGRVIMELKPTECPDPPFVSDNYAFYDLDELPEVKSTLTTDAPGIMRKAADGDQDILRDLYVTALRARANSNKTDRKTGGPELRKYLNMSRYHVELRNFLKHAIRFKIIPKYFDYPPGMSWLILSGIIDDIVEDSSRGSPEGQRATERSESSGDTSEQEYNLEWSSEKSFSDLSHRSNLSMATEPAEVNRVPICKRFLTTPRGTKSEPAWKIHEIKPPDENLSYTFGYDYSPPVSHVCDFTQDDLLALEKANPPRPNEPAPPAYQLEDLMNLGLV